MNQTLVLDLMNGMGDVIYARPIIRRLKERYPRIAVTASWPQLMADLGVTCIRPQTNLRTQLKNVARASDTYQVLQYPNLQRRMRLAYSPQEIEKGTSILASLAQSAGLPTGPLDLSLPTFDPPPVAGRYIVVRPATERTEWLNAARNPDPNYLYQAAQWARGCGYTLVSVADLHPGKEWPLPPLPPADIVCHQGEFTVTQLVSLVRGAAGVITGVGWPIVMAQATLTPALVILGGNGLHNAPDRITDRRVPHNLVFAKPDKYCMCKAMQHSCDKGIADLRTPFEEFMALVVQGEQRDN